MMKRFGSAFFASSARRDEFVRDSDQQLLAFAFDQITSVCVVRILILRPCFRLHKKRNVTDLTLCNIMFSSRKHV
jgi:hypothetical protein